MQSIDESFDDGYLEGVDDARRRPAFADSHVQDILNDRADEHFESLVFGEDGWVTVEDDCRTYAG
jgi:hypothetical protein